MTTPNEVLTPRLRDTGRKWLFWVVAGFVLLVAGVASLAIVGSGSSGNRLDPTNPAPAGAKAVAEVLRSQGVEITLTDTVQETLDALQGGNAATLVLHDPQALLGTDRLGKIVGKAATTVLLEPAFDVLDVFAPSVAPAGVVTGSAVADCTAEGPKRAGTVLGSDVSYRVLDDSTAITCFPASGDDRYRYVELTAQDHRVIVLGATSALTNEAATASGNGALALAALGEHTRLVWFVPGLAEFADETPPTIGDLSPGWVVPLALLAILLVIGAGVVQGRRMGPLVFEPLPVTVPASETMRGRARLYEAAGARLRAADALRVGAIGRLSATLGLGSTAEVNEVISAVAFRIGAPLSTVRDLLLDTIPASDQQLLKLSEELQRLEREVRKRSHP